MGLPGFDTHPCPDILPEPLHFTITKELGSNIYMPVIPLPPSPTLSTRATTGSSSILSSMSSSPLSEDHCMQGKRPKNKCPHCDKSGHFRKECKTPHLLCEQRKYCKVRVHTSCPFPRAHGRQARMIKKGKRKVQRMSCSGNGPEHTPEVEDGYIGGIDTTELAINVGETLHDMDWSN